MSLHKATTTIKKVDLLTALETRANIRITIKLSEIYLKLFGDEDVSETEIRNKLRKKKIHSLPMRLLLWLFADSENWSYEELVRFHVKRIGRLPAQILGANSNVLETPDSAIVQIPLSLIQEINSETQEYFDRPYLDRSRMQTAARLIREALDI